MTIEINLPDFIEWVDAVNHLIGIMFGLDIEDMRNTRNWRWDAAYHRGLTPTEAVGEFMSGKPFPWRQVIAEDWAA